MYFQSKSSFLVVLKIILLEPTNLTSKNELQNHIFIFLFQVSSNIPNLHPAEKTILERLCFLGSRCKYLSEFVKQYKIHSLVKKSIIFD